MLNLVFLDSSTIGEVPNLYKLKEFGNFIQYETSGPAQALERVAEADIIITNKVLLDKNLIDHAKKLQLICIAATGMNNVDLGYAASKGIPVKNVAGYSTHSVAQSTFSMIFYLLGHLRYYDDYVKSGQYSRSRIFTHLGRPFWEMNGKTFGIIGLGAIGKKVASIAQSFGADIIYYSTSGKNNDPAYKRVELDELISQSDILSIHAPLNENTQDLINRSKLNRMKKHAILINAGRGGIVNETDLAEAIDYNIIAGAGIDVLSREPIDPDNPLLKIRNKDRLIILPHVAWASVEARTLLIDKIFDNISKYLASNQKLQLDS
jgi:lactate dehydrogenase-like 2-hydroxyacid dehydrogenase